jgi:hypothetical protein
MPNIREYRNPIEGFNVSAGPAERQARVAMGNIDVANAWGGAIGGAIQGVGVIAEEWKKKQTREEISQGSALEAKLVDTLSRNWNEAARQTDVNDTNLSPRWRQEVLEPALENFVGAFRTEEGREYATQRANAIRSTFFDRTNADSSVRAGDAALQNYRTLVSSTATATNTDPSLLDHNLGLINGAVDAYLQAAENLTARDASELRTKLTDAARQENITASFLGRISSNPEAFLAEMQAGQLDKYLHMFPDGSARQKFINAAEQQIQVNKTAEKAAREELRKQQVEQVDRASVELLAAQVDETGNFRFTPDFFLNVTRIAQLPGAKREDVTSLYNAGQSVMERQAAGQVILQDDPQTYQNFKDRMFLPSSDLRALSPQEVYEAIGRGALTDKTAQYFLKGITDGVRNPQYVEQQRKFDQAVGAWKGLFSKTSLTSIDAAGDIAFQDFVTRKRQEFEAGLQAGLTPDDMLDRSSKNNIFRDAASYLLPEAFLMDPNTLERGANPLAPKDALIPPPPGVPKRLPNETPLEYRKRISGGGAPPPPAPPPTITQSQFEERFAP